MVRRASLFLLSVGPSAGRTNLTMAADKGSNLMTARRQLDRAGRCPISVDVLIHRNLAVELVVSPSEDFPFGWMTRPSPCRSWRMQRPFATQTPAGLQVKQVQDTPTRTVDRVRLSWNSSYRHVSASASASRSTNRCAISQRGKIHSYYEYTQVTLLKRRLLCRANRSCNQACRV